MLNCGSTRLSQHSPDELPANLVCLEPQQENGHEEAFHTGTRLMNRKHLGKGVSSPCHLCSLDLLQVQAKF